MASLDLDTTNCLHCNVQLCRYFKYLNYKFGIQVHRSDHFNNKKILRGYTLRVVTLAFIGH